MSQIPMAIFLAYSNSGINSCKNVRRDLKMAVIFEVKMLHTASI